MKTLKQYLGYAAAALAAALVVSLASAGGGMLRNPSSAEDEDDDYVSEVYPALAGVTFDTEKALLKLIRTGVQYDSWGDQQVFGTSVIEFKNVKDGEPKSVVARRLYFCKPKTFITESVVVLDNKGTELAKAGQQLITPRAVDNDASAVAEFKFMCSVPKRACIAKDCV